MNRISEKQKKDKKGNSVRTKQMKTIVDRIVKRFGPEKIILFGSQARGDAEAGSDIDLLVVMPVKGSRRAKAVEIGVALHDIQTAKDVIVVTPQDYEWRKDVIGTIEWPAAHEGKVLYDKP
jgi:uncharacterized protein